MCYNDLINQNLSSTVVELSHSISASMDDYFINVLKVFGITKENIFEYKDRIRVEEIDIGSVVCRRIFLDDTYVISIIVDTMPVLEDGKYVINMKTEYELIR